MNFASFLVWENLFVCFTHLGAANRLANVTFAQGDDNLSMIVGSPIVPIALAPKLSGSFISSKDSAGAATRLRRVAGLTDEEDSLIPSYNGPVSKIGVIHMPSPNSP